MSEFSEWLTRTMEERGLGSRALGDRIGTGHSNIKGWRSGTVVPTWHTCRDIALALDVPPQFVRQLAGYVDPEEEPLPEDADLTELVAIYRELDPEAQQGAMLVMRGLRAQRQMRERRRSSGRG